MNVKTLTSGLSGVSGEYFVAAELSRLGYIASITLRNTKGVDILCSNADVTKQAGIQVKTNRRSNREWVLNSKSEKNIADSLFYVFVCLNDNLSSPDYFIVPSGIVAEYATKTHKAWMDAPGRNGRTHQDNTIRKFVDTEEFYKNRWDILGL